MAGLRIVKFTWLAIIFYHNLNLIFANYVCKEKDYIGYCQNFGSCETLKDRSLTWEMLDNKDCRKSGLIGMIICCPRMKYVRRPSRITTTSTTTKKYNFWPHSYEYKPPNNSPTHDDRNHNAFHQKDFHPYGLSLLNQNCGKVNDVRVAHAVNAVLGEFPWMAILLDARMEPLCGGSVITDRFVLTAAHCITDHLHLVRLGEHRRSTKEDCFGGICQRYLDFGIDPLQRPVVHPEFETKNHRKDIALIKLNTTINFVSYPHIQPICLSIKSIEHQLTPGDDLVLAGWGLKENDRPVDTLQKGMLKLETLDRCKQVYPRFTIDNSKLCIRASAWNSVSCRGDSGGPLFRKAKYQRFGYIRYHYIQVGLVSLGYGRKCGDLTTEPFMYENVTDSSVWLTHALYNAS
ncbi:serine protease 7 isoform X1 [Ceratitis capitata]|uniref:serine protease 7 isoform X1 n=1 Tax=Ceratitis capitata TaxID=7213 RepID=UPI000329EB91|nr:serine protease 7 isoform X1 [Ceratitis capitata]